MIRNLAQAVYIMVMAYSGVFLLGFCGVNFSSFIFSSAGLIVVFNLALVYTFYFKL